MPEIRLSPRAQPINALSAETTRASCGASGQEELPSRHPTGEDAQVPYKIGSWFTYSDPFLRLYAHPRLLRAVESVYGEEFVPFNESMVIKRGEIAPAISWHQVRPSSSDSALRQPVAFQVLADTHTGARMVARTGTGSGPSTDLISW